MAGHPIQGCRWTQAERKQRRSNTEPRQKTRDGAPRDATFFFGRASCRKRVSSRSAPLRRFIRTRAALFVKRPQAGLLRQPCSWQAVVMPPGGAPRRPGTRLRTAHGDAGRFPQSRRLMNAPSKKTANRNIIRYGKKSRLAFLMRAGQREFFLLIAPLSAAAMRTPKIRQSRCRQGRTRSAHSRDGCW